MDPKDPNVLKGKLQGKNWPLPKFYFVVKLGTEKWNFQEVGNLTTSVEVLKHRHGRSGQTGVYKIPGMPQVEDVTLKRGTFTGDTRLFEWFKSGLGKNPDRRDVTISLQNQLGKAEIIWTLSKAFPVKIEGGGFDSKATGDSAVAVESITLTFEEMEVEDLKKMNERLGNSA
ncbi:MAG TPA: phage tail protein [Flavobacteriales bacterium]|jgi:phage tail-like protein|nr:phage tail protein [Flavobacteriales bacterium]HAW21479.1 phage tail protein [Flavobacteriales bacterium]